MKNLRKLQLALLKIGLSWQDTQSIGEDEALALVAAYSGFAGVDGGESNSSKRFTSSRKKVGA